MGIILCIATDVLGFVCFFKASGMSPGRVDSQSSRCRERYKAALRRAAMTEEHDTRTVNWWGERAPVIHQLQIVGPPRSKYCKALRECVPIFDHYCDFLRNSVGANSYPLFCAVI